MKDTLLTAIDIGSSKITSVISTKDAIGNLRILGFDTTPSRGVKKGLIVDIDEVTKALNMSLEKAERMAGRTIEGAFIGVGGPNITSQNSHGVVAVSSTTNSISAEDVQRVTEAAKAISIPSTRAIIQVTPKEFILDGQEGVVNPVGMSAVRLEVVTHIITASLTNLNNLERVFTSLGVQNMGFVFSGLASSNAVVSDTEKELGVVVVDIGGGKTDITVYNEGALCFTGSVAIGAKHITNDIAAGTHVTLEDAEKIKLYISTKLNADKRLVSTNHDEILQASDIGIDLETPELSMRDIVKGIMTPRIEELFEMIMLELKKGDALKGAPSGIVLTGGGALTGGMTTFAKRYTGLPSRVGVPKNLSGIADTIESPMYATAVGLLMRAADSGAEHAQLSHSGGNFLKQLPFTNVFDTIKKFIKQYKV
jgi:cell division protein FtsA